MPFTNIMVTNLSVRCIGFDFNAIEIGTNAIQTHEL